MADQFGPQAEHVEELLDAVRDLTDEEVASIGRAWDATQDLAWKAWYASGDATVDAERHRAWSLARLDAWYAVQDAARDATRGAARNAAQAAARALAMADLVGQYGLTQEHIAALVGPCSVVPRLAAIIDRALPTIAKEN